MAGPLIHDEASDRASRNETAITKDELGNEYECYGRGCFYFKKFVGFSPKDIAHEHWLESCTAGRKCYKCNEIGHWGRDCPIYKHEPSTEVKLESEGVAPHMKPSTGIAKKSIARADPKPRVLQKPPPRLQQSVMAVFSKATRP